MSALQLNADLWMRIYSHIPERQLLWRVAPVCKDWREWVLIMTSRVLQAQIGLPRDVLFQESSDQVCHPIVFSTFLPASALYMSTPHSTLVVAVNASNTLRCVLMIPIVASGRSKLEQFDYIVYIYIYIYASMSMQ